ncbi:hypothetical protein SAMN03159384_07196, partial [Burkholderia sp. NFACC33-1]
WSVSAYGGTFQGVDLNYSQRFDRWFSQRNGRNPRTGYELSSG